MSEEGERKQQEELNPRGKPTREKAAGICWHQNRGEADLTHWMEDRGMASSSRLELEPNHHKEFNPLKLEPWSMEGWEKAVCHQRDTGDLFWMISAPRGEKASVPENSRPQTCLHAALCFKFAIPAWSVKPEFEKSAQSVSWLFATIGHHHKHKYKSSLETVSSSQIPTDEDHSKVSSQLHIIKHHRSNSLWARVGKRKRKEN